LRILLSLCQNIVIEMYLNLIILSSGINLAYHFRAHLTLSKNVGPVIRQYRFHEKRNWNLREKLNMN